MSVEAAIRAVPSFSALAPQEIEALVAAVDVRDHADGEVFLRDGAGGDAVYLLLEGTVKVSRDHGATELNQMGPGELFGLVALVDDAPRSATCSALGPCKVGAWPTSVVRLLFNQRSAIAYAFQQALGAQLARDLRQLDQRVRKQLRTTS